MKDLTDYQKKIFLETYVSIRRSGKMIVIYQSLSFLIFVGWLLVFFQEAI